MGIFDVFRKKSSVVWRDSNGKIRCLGDECPQKKCDDTCPIWCSTMGHTMTKMGHADKAIECFKNAINLAPDFKDAWVCLAAIHGGMGNYAEANKSYRVAYSIDSNYKNAIFGLIMSYRDLGQFEEALKFCDEYAQKIDKTEAEGLRMQVLEKQKTGKTIKRESVMNMALKIIAHARSIGLLKPNDNFPHIPEIMVECKSVCIKVFQSIVDDGDNNGKNPVVWLAWGAYAGMGAVSHWNLDWDALKTKGIAETLLEPRGSFAMDEYVLDSIGIPFETDEGKTLGENIFDLAIWSFNEFTKGASEGSDIVSISMEIMQSMYLFGMVFEMENLGMR